MLTSRWPDDAKSSPSGAALASAITSATFLPGRRCSSSRRLATSEARKTGWKSLL